MPVPRIPSIRFIVRASVLLGLAAAILYVFGPGAPPTNFMDNVLSFITAFVGMSIVAAIFIMGAVVFYAVVVWAFTSDN